MPQVAITFDAAPAEALLTAYPAKVQRATVRALNRALTSGRATMARLVASDMGMLVGKAKEKIREEKATQSNLTIRLRASLKRIPLHDFKSQGVKGRSKIPGAFIATMPNAKGEGHTGVFKRVGKPRLPIRELYGPSIGRVFIKHQAAGIEQMRTVFAVNLEHELKFAATESG